MVICIVSVDQSAAIGELYADQVAGTVITVARLTAIAAHHAGETPVAVVIEGQLFLPVGAKDVAEPPLLVVTVFDDVIVAIGEDVQVSFEIEGERTPAFRPRPQPDKLAVVVDFGQPVIAIAFPLGQKDLAEVTILYIAC